MITPNQLQPGRCFGKLLSKTLTGKRVYGRVYVIFSAYPEKDQFYWYSFSNDQGGLLFPYDELEQGTAEQFLTIVKRQNLTVI